MAKKFSLEAIFSLKDRISKPLGKIHTSLGKLGKNPAFKAIDKSADRALGSVGKLSSALGIAGVLSVGAFAASLQSVMKDGAEFEKMLIRTGSAFEKPVRVGTAGFAKLDEAAREVGRTTEFSALQGAEGLNSLATAGYTVEQSIAALPKVINFASAANLELSQSSDIASDSLGAFSLRSANAQTNAKNMARVMDSLTRAAADSTTNVAELFEGIKMGGAFAATSGASLEQFVAMQGVLANKGIKGAEAGTAIRNSFLHLTKPTAEATDKMASLGIKIAKTKDGSIDMIGTIANFEKGTKKLTRAQKANAVATVFGAYTVGPFLSLMDAGSKTISKFQKNLERAGGTTDEMAEQMRGSRSAQIARFFNVIGDVKLTVFDAIAPTVLSIADSVGKWVSANKELIGTKAGEWAATLKDKLPEIWTWTVRIGKAFAVFTVAALAVKALTIAITAYEAVTTIAAGAAWLYTWALDGSTAATGRSRIATVGLKIAQYASRAATLVMTAAQFAYTGQLHFATIASIRLKVAEVATKIALIASSAATWIAQAASVAYSLATGIATGQLGAFRVAAMASVPAITAQVTAMAPLLATLAAVTAAVVALKLAWDQYNALDKELEGSGGVSGTVSKMWDMGTFDPFKAHDAVMDEKARETANRDRDRSKIDERQIISPQVRAAEEYAAATAASARVEGKIVVGLEPGTKAKVKNKPKQVPLVVAPSGAL
jgi:TP901 family phage tail tape measure protein